MLNAEAGCAEAHTHGRHRAAATRSGSSVDEADRALGLHGGNRGIHHTLNRTLARSFLFWSPTFAEDSAESPGSALIFINRALISSNCSSLLECSAARVNDSGKKSCRCPDCGSVVVGRLGGELVGGSAGRHGDFSTSGASEGCLPMSPTYSSISASTFSSSSAAEMPVSWRWAKWAALMCVSFLAVLGLSMRFVRYMASLREAQCVWSLSAIRFCAAIAVSETAAPELTGRLSGRHVRNSLAMVASLIKILTWPQTRDTMAGMPGGPEG
mmetsp:Transcript_59504/g.134149  ORF Transcript_59504/g.134149 Transcript_59504/m.134149 type:complete len:270 (-) Transcript_59504:45-854(-)